MRKLILQMQTSIDMFVGDNDGDTSWMKWHWNPDWTWSAGLQQYHIDTTASADCILLSDKMAEEGFIDHWGAMAKQTDNPESAFARNITNAQKVIFGTSLKTARWKNSTIANGELVSAVRDVKQAPGKNLLAFGGARFASSLINADLVDEFHLIVNPTILGSGLPIFSTIPSARDLTLLSATSYPVEVVVLQYAKK
jgi:dihydrofolate reductase